MIENYIINHPWIPAIAWLVIYTSDYYLTLWGAKLFQKQNYIKIEGSYELNPVYQEDINKQRRFSPRFLFFLILIPVLFLILGYWCLSEKMGYAFAIVIGASFFVEIAVHIRHIDNVILSRKLLGSNPGVSGSMVYSRHFVYQRSVVQFIGFAIFMLIAFVITLSPMLLGGTLGLAVISQNHRKLAKKQECSTNKPTE